MPLIFLCPIPADDLTFKKIIKKILIVKDNSFYSSCFIFYIYMKG